MDEEVLYSLVLGHTFIYNSLDFLITLTSSHRDAVETNNTPKRELICRILWLWLRDFRDDFSDPALFLVLDRFVGELDLDVRCDADLLRDIKKRELYFLHRQYWSGYVKGLFVPSSGFSSSLSSNSSSTSSLFSCSASSSTSTSCISLFSSSLSLSERQKARKSKKLEQLTYKDLETQATEQQQLQKREKRKQSAKIIAEHLTMWQWGIQLIWTSKEVIKGTHLDALSHMRRTSEWVTNCLKLSSNRRKTFLFFVEVLKNCFQFMNFATTHAILHGLPSRREMKELVEGGDGEETEEEEEEEGEEDDDFDEEEEEEEGGETEEELRDAVRRGIEEVVLPLRKIFDNFLHSEFFCSLVC